MITSTISLPTKALTPPLPEENEEIITITNNQNTTKNLNMETTESCLRKSSNLPQTFESLSEPQTEKIHDKKPTHKDYYFHP